jgi:hypothetical protein
MKFKLLLTLVTFLCSCQYIGAGSLGAWRITGFPITDKELLMSVKELFKEYPQYRIPEKWKYETEYWKNEGFDTTKTMVFYFNNNPEEMYFVTLAEPGIVKNPEFARIAIAAIYNDQEKDWKEIKKYNDQEKLRTEQRFQNEIISKLENLTKTKTFDEKTYP